MIKVLKRKVRASKFNTRAPNRYLGLHPSQRRSSNRTVARLVGKIKARQTKRNNKPSQAVQDRNYGQGAGKREEGRGTNLWGRCFGSDSSMERNSKRLENLSASFNGGENCGQPSRVLLYPYPKERREDWIETLAPLTGWC